MICVQTWNSATEIAEAYTIGKMESGAAMQLLKSVDPEVTESLACHVKTHSLLSESLHFN